MTVAISQPSAWFANATGAHYIHKRECETIDESQYSYCETLSYFCCEKRKCCHMQGLMNSRARY